MLLSFIRRRWKALSAGGIVLIIILQTTTNIFVRQAHIDAITRFMEHINVQTSSRMVKPTDSPTNTWTSTSAHLHKKQSWTRGNGHDDRTRAGSLHAVDTGNGHPLHVPHKESLPPLFHMTGSSDPKFNFRQNPNWKNSTCPTSLRRRAFESKEFGSIFRPDTQMFMNSKLFDVSEYWRLKKWRTPYGYKYDYNITYEEVRDVLNMFPAEDTIFNFNEGSRPECVSCAVVGNGGILNGSGMGKEIDMHDFIFRVNQAYIKGYEKDVGRRTTHFVFFDRSLGEMSQEDYPGDKNTTYIFVPCRKADYLYLRTIGEERNRFKVPPENIRVIHPDFMRYMHYVWMKVSAFRPTTGGIMTMTALHVCDKLSLYGLGFNTKYSDHYYDRKYQEFTPYILSHDYIREIKLWDSSDKEGIVYWYRRDVGMRTFLANPFRQFRFRSKNLNPVIQVRT